MKLLNLNIKEETGEVTKQDQVSGFIGEERKAWLFVYKVIHKRLIKHIKKMKLG